MKQESHPFKGWERQLTKSELWDTLEEAYLNAIDQASLEVAEGLYEPDELEKLVNRTEILQFALSLILSGESS